MINIIAKFTFTQCVPCTRCSDIVSYCLQQTVNINIHCSRRSISTLIAMTLVTNKGGRSISACLKSMHFRVILLAQTVSAEVAKLCKIADKFCPYLIPFRSYLLARCRSSVSPRQRLDRHVSVLMLHAREPLMKSTCLLSRSVFDVA